MGQIALSHNISEKNVVFFSFYTQIQDGRQKWQENNFWEKCADDSADTLGVKYVTKTAVCRTVSEINSF